MPEIIAEIANAHQGNPTVALKLAKSAKKSGASAVKFQIYDAGEAFSKNEMTTDVKLDHLYGVHPWWEVARDKILMPRDWFGEMFAYVRSKNLIPLSAIHRPEDVDFLKPFGLPVIKIASIDLHYHHLLKQLIPYKIPFLISTGMAYLSEIDDTMRMLESEGVDETILLHCVSRYPPRPEELNLKNITTLQHAFNVPVGFSDHSTGIVSAIAAVVLGATVIEKHITLDKTYPGPDHIFALEPCEMKQLVDAVRETELALGKTQREMSVDEFDARKMIRRSLVSKVQISIGEKISLKNIKFSKKIGLMHGGLTSEQKGDVLIKFLI